MKCQHCNADNADAARFCGVCGQATSATEPSMAGRPALRPSSPDLVGREIAGRYRVLAKLGEGGMGAVYRGEQISLKRRVAIKLLRPELSADPGMVRRFNAEAELAAKLSHPNTVNIYDFGQDVDGTLFIAMEYVEGKSLRQAMSSDGPLPAPRALAIARQIASSLTDAHAHGIVHRDLKPDNVMLTERGKDRDVARVLDFGIAKLRDERGTVMPMTQAGDLVGTPQYMAPEQIRGEKVDGRTDIYALGAMLYEMVTGRLPFEGQTVMAILSRHLLDTPEAPVVRRPDLGIPPALDALIMETLAKAPDQRPPSMEQLAERLAGIAAAGGWGLSGNLAAVGPSGAMGAALAPTGPLGALGGFTPSPGPPGPAGFAAGARGDLTPRPVGRPPGVPHTGSMPALSGPGGAPGPMSGAPGMAPGYPMAPPPSYGGPGPAHAPHGAVGPAYGAGSYGPGPGPGRPMHGGPQFGAPPRSLAWLWILLALLCVGGAVAGVLVAGSDKKDEPGSSGSGDDDDVPADPSDPWAVGPGDHTAPIPMPESPDPPPTHEEDPTPPPAPEPVHKGPAPMSGGAFTHALGWSVVLPEGVVQDPTAKEPFTSFASPDATTLIVIASMEIDSTGESDAELKQGAADLAAGFNGKLINSDFVKIQGARRLRAVIETGQVRFEAIAFLQENLTLVAMYGVPTARYNGAALERRDFFEHRIHLPSP